MSLNFLTLLCNDPIKQSFLVSKLLFLFVPKPYPLLLSTQVFLSSLGPFVSFLTIFLLVLGGPSVLPFTCPSQIFSFEINVSVAIITFASRPKVIMSVLYDTSRDVMEVMSHLEKANYKGMGVIKGRCDGLGKG